MIGKKILEGYKNWLRMNKKIEMVEELGKGREFPKKVKMELIKPKRKISYEGINIPEIPYEIKEVERKKEIEFEYPLTIDKGKIYAMARIRFDENENQFIYEVIEPVLNYEEEKALKILENYIREKLGEVYMTENVEDELRKLFDLACRLYRINDPEIIDKFWYYVKRDFLGYGKIDALMRDDKIEDISCDGVNIPVFVIHKEEFLGSLKTNIIFKDQEELDSFVQRLAQLCGKHLSVAQPLVDGILPDGSRLQATLATDIAPRGSNFTIRKFARYVLTPIHLIRSKTLDPKTLAFLWFCIDYGRNILISGGTGTGKTTLLNVLASFIRPEKKIVSIEDTAELKLLNENWVQHIARVPISSGKEGEVDLFELLRAALRQRPDYIIVGEVRGAEASILFQGMATGHTGLATIHAEDIIQLLDRLKTKPIELSPSLIEILDIIVFIKRLYYRGKFVRRVSNVVEIIKATEKEVNFVEVISWNATNDKFEIKNKSKALYKIKSLYGLSEAEIKEEIINRAKFLIWLYENNVYDFNQFYNYLKLYYTQKDRILELIK